MKWDMIFGVIFSKNNRVTLQLCLRRDLGFERWLRGPVGEERENGRQENCWEDVQEEGAIEAAHHRGKITGGCSLIHHKGLISIVM